MGILSILVMTPLVSAAGGIGTGPMELKLSQAMKGGEYERTIWVFSRFDEPADFLLYDDGDIKGWASFYDPVTKEKITKITIPAKDRKELLVKFTIPLDIANGVYTGKVYAQSVPSEAEEGQVTQTVSVASGINVEIEVTGEQILEGIAQSISALDVEVDYPLRINVDFRNTGNVMAKPEIKADISQDGSIIDSLVYSGAEIKPNSRETLSAEWDTTGKEPGNYQADVSVFLASGLVDKKDLTFEILPLGTLTREGILTDLAYESAPQLGVILKILAMFKNTGKIDTKAKFIGEVYKDGALLSTIESYELLTLVGASENLPLYFKLTSPGDYLVKGHVLYEGKKTEEKELAFSVEGFGETEKTSTTKSSIKITGDVTKEAGEGLPLGLLAGGALFVLIVLVVLVFLWKR